MSFLNRYRDSWPPDRAAPAAPEARSIAVNLQRLLGSQREYASFLADFGLGETWHRPVTPKTIELLRLEVLAQIKRYEPRLHDPQVDTLPSLPDGTLRFALSGQLSDGKPLQLFLSLSPSRAGRALIEGAGPG